MAGIENTQKIPHQSASLIHLQKLVDSPREMEPPAFPKELGIILSGLFFCIVKPMSMNSYFIPFWFTLNKFFANGSTNLPAQYPVPAPKELAKPPTSGSSPFKGSYKLHLQH